MALIILICIAWYIIGIAGFIFWWTKDWDFGYSDIATAVFTGFMGPLTWLIGMAIHGGRGDKSVIIKRREK